VQGLHRFAEQVKEILWRLVGNGSELMVAGFRSSLEEVIGSHEKMEGKRSSRGLSVVTGSHEKTEGKRSRRGFSGASAEIIDAHQVVHPLDIQIVKLRV
jgi:hypothetical protein